MGLKVKGLVFLSVLLLLISVSWALVMVPIMMISAVKVVVALVSILTLPLTGIVHLFIKGDTAKKALIVFVSLLIVGVAAYLLMIASPRIVVEPLSFSAKNLYLKAPEDIKGSSDGLQANDAPVFDLTDEVYFLGSRTNATEYFIKSLLIFGFAISLIISILFTLSGSIYQKMVKKPLNVRKVLLGSFSLGCFLGFLLSFVLLTLRIGL